MGRPGFGQYFMAMARVAATRSTCKRRKVGAVIVLNNNVVATGYNGSLRGAAHCDDVGCLMEEGHCVRTVHAEANAILQAAKRGVSIEGAAIYTTSSPCWHCFKLIANAGITRIGYADDYPDKRFIEEAVNLGIPAALIQETQEGVAE
jgi:dCMP deaminase